MSGENSDGPDQPIQLIRKPECGSNAPLGVANRGFAGVLKRCRAEAGTAASSAMPIFYRAPRSRICWVNWQKAF